MSPLFIKKHVLESEKNLLSLSLPLLWNIVHIPLVQYVCENLKQYIKPFESS